MVSSTDTQHGQLYHYGLRKHLDSILRCGLIAGGSTATDSAEQWKCYFSIRSPKDDTSRDDPLNADDPSSGSAGRPARPRATSKVNDVVFPPDAHADTIFTIDIALANQMGTEFYQDVENAVFCDNNLPPECIIKVESLRRDILLFEKPNFTPGIPRSFSPPPHNRTYLDPDRDFFLNIDKVIAHCRTYGARGTWADQDAQGRSAAIEEDDDRE